MGMGSTPDDQRKGQGAASPLLSTFRVNLAMAAMRNAIS